MTHTATSGTVGPIIFSDVTAREQLLHQGEVVTFRKNTRTTGETWWRESRLGPKRGNVVVTEIMTVDPADRSSLMQYQELSGFENVTAWQNTIAQLNGSLPSKGRLYRVEKC